MKREEKKRRREEKKKERREEKKRGKEKMGVVVSMCGGPSMQWRQAEFLSLSRYDVARLSRTYCSIKRDKNGFVEINNVLKYFKVNGNIFMEKMFNLLNRDDEKDLPLINFEEFVYLTWNFASCDNLGEKSNL